MVNGYEAKIESLETAHAEELDGVKAEYAASENTILQKQQETIDKAVAEGRAECEALFKQLKREIADLRTKSNNLRSTLDETLAEKKTQVFAAESKTSRAQNRITALEQLHARETANLQRQLKVGPNSWVETSVVSKGRKTRTLVRRLHSTFKAFTEEYYSQSGCAASACNTFSHKGHEIVGWSKTLQEVGNVLC